MTEHLGYEELLWKAEELHPPDTEDYVRLVLKIFHVAVAYIAKVALAM